MKKLLLLFLLGPLLSLLLAQQQFTPYPTPTVQFESDPLTASSLQLNYTGASGQTTFWYRVIATFPRGQGPSSAPVTVTMSGTPTASNPVRLSWNTVPGATSYSLIRTSTVSFSSPCTCLVASGNITSAVDNGGALSSFTHSPVGAATGALELNNRDYATAKFELSYPLLDAGGGVPVDLGLGDLTDVTLSSPAQNDVLVKSAGDWLNTNLLTAIGGAGLTNGRVPYTASGALTDSTRLQYNGGRMLLTADGSVAPLQFTGSNTTNLRMIDSTNLGAGTSGMRFQYAAGGSAEYGNSNVTGIVNTSKRLVIYQAGTAEYSQPNIQFWVTAPHADSAYVFMKGAGVNPVVRINASAFTMRVSDETATTGDTELIVKEGAGQASASFQVVDNSDGELFSVNSGGGFGGPGRALANLGTPNDGKMEYCTDCLKGSDPCSASSTGAMAMRVNGAWQCM